MTSTTAPAGRSPEPPITGVHPQKSTGFAALQSRNFRLLWIGLLISNAGTWMASTGEGWLVTGLKPENAAFWIGMISVSFALPMIIVPPFGGAIADRLPRMRVLWTVQGIFLVLSAAVAALTLWGQMRVEILMVFAFMNGLVLAFDSPVRHALLPEIVSRDQLSSAVSLNSAAFTAAALVGPALAGVLIKFIGVGGVFVCNAITCVGVLIAIWQMKNIPAHRPRTGTEGVFASIKHGLVFVRQSKLIGALLLASIISGVFARSFGPLLAVFARDVFHIGSAFFGLLVAAPGLGALVGALGLASRGSVRAKGRLLIAATVAYAVALAAFSVTPWYWVALPLLVVVGLTAALTGALIATLIQMQTPHELRGRVMSFYMLTLIGVPSAGVLVSGIIADATSVQFAVGGGAVLMLVATLVLFTLNPSIRNAE